jgi:branched-chain amino acid transport system ATP-binding protein
MSELARPLLEVEGLDVYLGGSHVLKGVSFSVPEGGVTALLGRNGVGKTTTIRAIMGLSERRGRVSLDGAELARERTDRIVRRGVGYVPEDRDVFATLTVEENLRLAERNGSARYELVFDLFPELRQRGGQRAGTLSGGQQQMLAVARALMLRPRLLLLDEPSFGLAPMVVKEIFEVMRDINRTQKVTILLVEQNAAMALKLADEAHLLETGSILMSGSSKDLMNDDAVRRAYLGY